MKRQFLKFAVAGTVLAVLAGCAASGIKHEQMAASMPGLKAGQGRVYFYRNASMVGAAISPDIRLNGQVVGESKSGGFFFVDRPAGNYVASASTETEKTLPFTLHAGETKYIRSSIGMGIVAGHVSFETENREKALGELASLSYTGAPTAAR